MNSDLFAPENMAAPATAPGLTQQNAKSLKYALDGECYARQGSMIAYRGELQFEKQGQGIGTFLKRAVTGEGLALMAVRGRGEVWFAHEAANCFIIDLAPGDGITVNGRNVLCFDPSLSYEIKVVKGAGMVGGGLFNSVFSGQGKLGVMCEGNPVVIPVSPQAPGLRRHRCGGRLEQRSPDHAAPVAESRLDAPGRLRGGRSTPPGRRGVRDRTAQ